MKTIPLVLGLLSLTTLTAQRDFSDVQITSEKLTENIYALFGAGGNIGLAIGEDAAYLIDDQFGPLTEKIVSHVKTLTDKPIHFCLLYTSPSPRDGLLSRMPSSA